MGRIKFELCAGKPVLMRLAEVDHIDGPGKPVGIPKFIGHRPIAAFGNSDGDFQMLQYTATGNGARLRDLDAKIREFLMPANELTWDSPTSFLSDRIGPNTKRESGTASALREEWKPYPGK